ncbi:unnamed protein product, partial [Effrenium voratum]
EIRKCIMGCKPIQEYFRYPSDDIFFFAVAKVMPLPQSVCSVWVFMGAEVKMSRQRILALSKVQKERELAAWEEANGIVEEEDDEDDLENFKPDEAPADAKPAEAPPPPEVKDDGQDLYANSASDRQLEKLQQGEDADADKKKDKKKKKKPKESE